MCGRFIVTKPEVIGAAMDTMAAPDGRVSHNIPPTIAVATVRGRDAGGRQLVMMRWGLVPYWAKAISPSSPNHNARLETVHEKPTFQQAFLQRRCLIPADGFYEWQRATADKKPYVFQLPDGEPFAFAGIWDRWPSPDGPIIESCAILTTEANAVMAPIHHRSPVILERSAYDAWLDPTIRDLPALRELLTTSVADRLVATRVSKRVNQVSNDDPRLLDPVDDDADGPRELRLFD